ncbi:Kinesin-like protein KIF26A [Echinococcus granulosus]|uniref:Kinesin-like protein KIF26A n=1 Tax=Echinococcus granulosus TaxID=6210 RepID=W6URM2_ECHGR|nr:Kinesin-like protein KIF26A [Echinococcus granulosus]EUB60952.1 Kinesin-like protein KIF26A [Echinococcus granulosus]
METEFRLCFSFPRCLHFSAARLYQSGFDPASRGAGASGERTLSTSTSKRSLSAPAGSSEESRSSSLPSVRRVSPQRSQITTAGCEALDTSTPHLNLNRSELTHANSDAIEVSRTTFRQRRIAALLQRQEQLKAELTDAKIRLLADPGSWSFDLNVAEHMNPNDEGFLEALTDETELLQQRVNACRSHAQYLAFFQPPPVPQPPPPPSSSHDTSN